MMARGKVKWYNDFTGYGVIERENGETVMYNFSDIVGECLETPQEGDEVEFDVAEGLNGFQAVNVEKI